MEEVANEELGDGEISYEEPMDQTEEDLEEDPEDGSNMAAESDTGQVLGAAQVLETHLLLKYVPTLYMIKEISNWSSRDISPFFLGLIL